MVRKEHRQILSFVVTNLFTNPNPVNKHPIPIRGYGLPELYNLPTVESEKQYVASVKDMILLRDISPFVI